MRLARLRPTAETGYHLDEVWAALGGTQQLGAKAPEGVTLMSTTRVSSALLQTSHGCWKRAEGLMRLAMMNFVILLNGNRTPTKSRLLFVTLLNVKSNNQPPSSQNEINCNST